MSKKILCVDDDPFYRDLYEKMLRIRGYQVTTAPNVASGWEAIQKDLPDAVLLDVMMPEQEGMFDGYGLLAKIKESPLYANIPVIMISALGDREDVKHSEEAGANAYLPKHEMNSDSLVSLIEKMTEAI